MANNKPNGHEGGESVYKTGWFGNRPNLPVRISRYYRNLHIES